MKKETLQRKRAITSIQILPWFMGLSDDLMFYIAISTLFLSIVKNLTAAQISLLTTVSALSYIILQRPFLHISKRIGNTYSVRAGAIILLLGAMILTFGESYTILMIGHILYMVSFLFKSMDNVMLKDNLIYLNKEDDYIKWKNKAQTIYSVITLIIALTSGFLFNIHHYLPMYLCLTVCVIDILLSFHLYDVMDKNTFVEQESKNEKTYGKVKFSRTILLILLSYGMFYATISIGQQNARLFIQYRLQDYFDTALTATYFSYIIAASRFARVFGNISFPYLFAKLKDRLNLLLPLIGILAYGLVIVGSFVSNITIKFIMMAIGFCLILLIRDVFNTYTQDLLFKKSKVSEQQKAISYLGLSRRLGECLLSFLFSMMLLKVDLIYVIVALIVFSFFSFLINGKLYHMVTQDKKQTKGEKPDEN